MQPQFEFANNAEWLAHRYDEAHDGFRFIRAPREVHRKATFLTDEHLKGTDQFKFVPRSDVNRVQLHPCEIHFVFHSAYCCSTMVARAFDIEGHSMGLKEPQILNDVLGWRRRGASADGVRTVLSSSLDLLARPFNGGEKVIIKPSNIVSPLVETILDLRPDANALFLYAPIESYLQSIAKKGLWGRKWVREVLIGTINDGYLVGGFEGQELLSLTDLQVAAVGWLSQHALYSRLISRFGGERISTLDSATLLADQPGVMAALFDHFAIALSEEELTEVLNGPAFTTHSKDLDARFGAEQRAEEQAEMAQLHADEIEKVAMWTHAVARSQGFALELPGRLTG